MLRRRQPSKDVSKDAACPERSEGGQRGDQVVEGSEFYAAYSKAARKHFSQKHKVTSYFFLKDRFHHAVWKGWWKNKTGGGDALGEDGRRLGERAWWWWSPAQTRLQICPPRGQLGVLT